MQKYTKFLKFLPSANAAATYSKDPSTKVGAIAIDDDYNIRAQGYNGFPRGVHDTEERLNDREQKYPRIVHAEANLVAMAARTGVSLQGCSVLLTSLHPCSSCAGLLIQAGVKRVFAPSLTENTRWDASSAVALEMFDEAGVEVFTYGEGRITSRRVNGEVEHYTKPESRKNTCEQVVSGTYLTQLDSSSFPIKTKLHLISALNLVRAGLEKKINQLKTNANPNNLDVYKIHHAKMIETLHELDRVEYLLKSSQSPTCVNLSDVLELLDFAIGLCHV